MGAAQNQGVAPPVQQRLQILPGHRLNDDVPRAEPPVLHQRHKQRAGLLKYADLRVQPPQRRLISPGSNGGQRGNHAHPAVPGHRKGPAAGGFHHAHNGQVVLPLEGLQGGGGHGAAGNQNGFQVKGPQKAEVLPGVFQQGLPGTAPVGHPGGVAKVNQILLPQNPPQNPHRRQAAKAGVKHADGPRIHMPSLLSEPDKKTCPVAKPLWVMYYTMRTLLPQDRF